jgi:hypothetical protein
MTESGFFRSKWLFAAPAAVLLLVVPALAFRGSSTGTLTGRVTLSGKPVVVGTVVVLAADGSVRSAELDPQGNYAVEGVPQGKLQIGVISRDPTKARQRQQRLAASGDRLTHSDLCPARAASKSWFPVPVRYEDPHQSGLGVTLTGTTEYHVELQ